MSVTIYKHIERLVHEKTIHLIDYAEFNQAGKPVENKHIICVKKKGKNDLVNLSLLKNFGIYNDSVTRLMIEEYATMDLRTYLKICSDGAPLTWHDKLLLTSGIVNGLKYLHDNDIIHSELHAKNIVMYNEIPKLTNIGMLQAHASGDFSFSKYSPPEILLSLAVRDKKKLNIYSLGVLMWEISNDGIEPFPQNVRPDCEQIIKKLKNISLSDSYDGRKIANTAGPRIYEPKPKPQTKKSIDLDLNCELDYEKLFRQKMLRVEFINHFALNRGRNLNGLDFRRGVGIILRDDGNPKICKMTSSSPVIYLPLNNESSWIELTNSSLFEIKNENNMGSKYDDVRIHIPISAVQYTAKPTDEFIQKIKSALNIPSESERRRALETWFNHFGNYVVKKVILGGAITIRDWSRVSDESKSYLKSYIQWGIDFGKGRTSEIFEDVPLDKLPKLETSAEIETIGDLYSWFKSLYSLKFAEIISYEEFIPSYELLPGDLQQLLFRVIGSKPAEASREKLIPNISSQYDKQDILKWIIMHPPLSLYLGDWVHNNELQCGVILQQSSQKHGKKAAFKFLKEPKITELNKITILLAQPQTLQDAYLLENGIVLKKDDGLGLELDKIPFAEHSSTLNYPLEDFKCTKDQPSKSIYCQIIVRMANISFNFADIKSLQEFSDAVNNALQSNEPYKNLCKVFGNDYGHLLPRTFTLGGILSKKYKSYTNTILPQRFEYNLNDPQTPQNIVKKLTEWNKELQHIDTSFFYSDSGDLVCRDDIGNWLKDLMNKQSDWKVINSEDWIPLYQILKKTRSDIDDIFNNYQIVFNGEESLQKDEQTTIIIKFPGSLIDNNYHCFGTIVKRNEDGGWVKIPKLFVRFDYLNKDGCAAYIHNDENCDIRLKKVDTKLLWFVLADPKGYCSNKNRNVKVVHGNFNIIKAQSEVALNSKNLSTNCVLVTSIASKNGSSFYDIKLKAWTKTKILLELTKDQVKVDSQPIEDGFDDTGSDGEVDNFDSDKMKQFNRETTVLDWCIIYTDEKMDSEADESLKYPWSIFGNNLDTNKKILGQDEIDLYERPSRMSLEDAMEQHVKQDGNRLEAWKTLVHHAREGNHIAKYWVGYYLQHDILTAFKIFKRKFYEEVVDEFAEGTDNYQLVAMKLYKQSADAGYPEAQLRYGFGLYNGNGINQDKKEAMRYFRLAAKNDNPIAMYNLGVGLMLGENEVEGKKWIIEAARLGHLKAVEFCNNSGINY
ncbi:9059_t:CDS:2 [Dentiscutata erythropus]|uniref:9059_t:CDS:1 n=1 Tax=Dentiscutata erythropus TaxID=1348616 RepID=A0A9N8V9Y9_9GLOM|nr:9059_t:CDS:2 [Dentiscutata erythropus]